MWLVAGAADVIEVTKDCPYSHVDVYSTASLKFNAYNPLEHILKIVLRLFKEALEN